MMNDHFKVTCAQCHHESFVLSTKFSKIFSKYILIKDEFHFEKYNFKIIQCCISTHGRNTRCTCRKTVEST